MKILHCCLACFYCDGYNYQENVLPRMNKLNGHDVKIIADTEKFLEDGQWGITDAKTYKNEDGITVTRLNYCKFMPRKIMRKLKLYTGLYKEIEEFKPDIILCHGGQSVSLLTIKKYLKANPKTRLFIDNHADENNSATNFISRNLLHKILFKNIMRSVNPYVEKYLYITYECKVFLKKMYNIDDEKLFYYPLGGMIMSEEDKEKNNRIVREELNLNESDIILVHSGKFDKKKLTKELVESIPGNLESKIKLLVIGQFTKGYENNVMPIINSNDNIFYLGWKNSDELLKYISAADLYIQPGSQSATMQNALCCGTAVAITSVKAHKYLLADLPFYIDSKEDIKELLNDIIKDSAIIQDKKNQVLEFAKKKLDYKMLAEKIVTGM